VAIIALPPRTRFLAELADVKLSVGSDVRFYRKARCAARRGIELLDCDDSMPARMLRAVLNNLLRGPGDDREAAPRLAESSAARNCSSAASAEAA
jgi:hypothetical protein